MESKTLSNDSPEKLAYALDDNRRLIRSLLAMQEHEQREMVELLHNDFGQSLVAIKSFAVAIQSLSKDELHEAPRLARDIKEIAEQTYQSAYDQMRKLRAGLIGDMGMEAAIASCMESARLRQNGVEAEVSVEGDLDALGDLAKVALLQTLQSCLAQIARHSKATHLNIELKLAQVLLDERRDSRPANSGSNLSRDWLTVEMTDNSDTDYTQNLDFETEMDKLKDQMRALGGELDVSRDANGCQYRINLDVTELKAQ